MARKTDDVCIQCALSNTPLEGCPLVPQLWLTVQRKARREMQAWLPMVACARFKTHAFSLNKQWSPIDKFQGNVISTLRLMITPLLT
jgi:hypothetical protein